LETGPFNVAAAMQFEPQDSNDCAEQGCSANPSNRRAGLNPLFRHQRENDLSANPNFKLYLCRSMDTFQHNLLGTPLRHRFRRPFSDLSAMKKWEQKMKPIPNMQENPE
jgi:hypothetical protein